MKCLVISSNPKARKRKDGSALTIAHQQYADTCLSMSTQYQDNIEPVQLKHVLCLTHSLIKYTCLNTGCLYIALGKPVLLFQEAHPSGNAPANEHSCPHVHH
jgi:hypothetical protein